MKYIVLSLLLFTLSGCATQDILYGYVVTRDAYGYTMGTEEAGSTSYENFELFEEK